MSERNKLTIPIKMINNISTLMTVRSVNRTMNRDPIVPFSVHFYLIYLNMRDIQKHIKSLYEN